MKKKYKKIGSPKALYVALKEGKAITYFRVKELGDYPGNMLKLDCQSFEFSFGFTDIYENI